MSEQTLIPFRVATLQEREPRRPEGFLQAYIDAAEWISPDGEILWLSQEKASGLRNTYKQFLEADKAAGLHPLRQAEPQSRPVTQKTFIDEYKGTRPRDELLREVRNIFDFAAAPLNPVVAEVRQKVLAETPQSGAMSPCKINSSVAHAAALYIKLINEYERSDSVSN